MSPTVGHFKRTYLSLTETFIYQYLVNHRRYDAFFAGIRAENVDKFPFQPRCILSEEPTWSPAFLYYGVQEMLTKVGSSVGFDALAHRGTPYYGSVIADRNPDILHAHFGHSGLDLLAYRSSDTPLVTSFYGYDASALVAHDESIVGRYRRMFDKGDRFLVEGPSMKQKLVDLGCPEGKVRLQRIAIDAKNIEPRYPSTEPDWTVLMVGRFVEKKGMPDGIRAFARAFAGSSAELRIVGGGSGEQSRAGLERIAAEEGVREQVTFTGFLDYEAYIREVRSCDILLAPSKRAASGDSEGGAPTVLLEAQAAGKPIVSTLHADIPFVVEEDVTGELVDPGDVDGLTDALMTLVADPERMIEMGKAGRARMLEHHDIDTLVDRLESQYDELI